MSSFHDDANTVDVPDLPSIDMALRKCLDQLEIELTPPELTPGAHKEFARGAGGALFCPSGCGPVTVEAINNMTNPYRYMYNGVRYLISMENNPYKVEAVAEKGCRRKRCTWRELVRESLLGIAGSKLFFNMEGCDGMGLWGWTPSAKIKMICDEIVSLLTSDGWAIYENGGWKITQGC